MTATCTTLSDAATIPETPSPQIGQPVPPLCHPVDCLRVLHEASALVSRHPALKETCLRQWGSDDGPAFAEVAAFVMSEAALSNEEGAASWPERRATVFDCAPGTEVSIPLVDYVRRFQKYTKATSHVLVATLVSVDRVSSLNAGLALSVSNAHRLFAASFVVTHKFQEDWSYANRYVAQVAGMSLDELNLLELEFFRRSTFNVAISEGLYSLYSSPCRTLASVLRHTGQPLFTTCDYLLSSAEATDPTPT